MVSNHFILFIFWTSLALFSKRHLPAPPCWKVPFCIWKRFVLHMIVSFALVFRRYFLEFFSFSKIIKYKSLGKTNVKQFCSNHKKCQTKTSFSQHPRNLFEYMFKQSADTKQSFSSLSNSTKLKLISILLRRRQESCERPYGHQVKQPFCQKDSLYASSMVNFITLSKWVATFW